MSTEQEILQKLRPPADHEVREEFIASIKRPSGLSAPTREECVVSFFEERLLSGELALAVGAFVALMVSERSFYFPVVIMLLLAALGAAGLIRQMKRGRVADAGFVFLAGGAATVLALYLTHLQLFIWLGPSLEESFHPLERFKAAVFLQPLRSFELMILGAGASAFVMTIARRKLEDRPWVSGEAAGSRRAWGALGLLVCVSVVLGFFYTPSPQERRTPGSKSYPLASIVQGRIMMGDTESLQEILNRYPDALDWYQSRNRVTNDVNSLETAKFLVGKGADFAPPQSAYETALYRAVEAKNDPLAEFLLRHGADPNEGRQLPLLEAVRQNRPYAVELLLDYGAQPDLAGYGGSALELASKFKDKSLYHALKDARR